MQSFSGGVRFHDKPKLGDSSILHCTSLRTVYDFHVISVQVHNIIYFTQARLDSKINTRSLLNKHGDLYFLLHNNYILVNMLDFLILKKN